MHIDKTEWIGEGFSFDQKEGKKKAGREAGSSVKEKFGTQPRWPVRKFPYEPHLWTSNHCRLIAHI